MPYRKVKYNKTRLKSVEKLEGEPIEHKIERIMNNKEPITDGAPEIFTERKEGVIAAYNIKTDRFEIACEAMDRVSGSRDARRAEKAKIGEAKEGKVIELEQPKESGKGSESKA